MNARIYSHYKCMYKTYWLKILGLLLDNHAAMNLAWLACTATETLETSLLVPALPFPGLSTCNLITFTKRRNAFLSSRGNNHLSHITIAFALPFHFPPACLSLYPHSQLLAIVFLLTWPLTLHLSTMVPLWHWHLNPVILLNAPFLT